MEFITESAKETKDLGKKIAVRIAEGLEHKAESKTIALVGDLGAGKTTFVQGFAQGLGISARIISPTFILMKSYKIRDKGHKLGSLYHLDFYRLEGKLANEVEGLGLPDMWKSHGNIILIEWAEKVRDYLPSDTEWVNIEVLNEEKRRIVVS